MPYYTIPQRLERLRVKSAAEGARRVRPHRQALASPIARKSFLEAMRFERRSLETDISMAQHRLKLINDVIAMYET